VEKNADHVTRAERRTIGFGNRGKLLLVGFTTGIGIRAVVRLAVWWWGFVLIFLAVQ
jgi:hypothetical protein